MSRSESGHGSSAFMTMLGGSLGCFAAVVLICGGMLFFVVQGMNQAAKDTPTGGDTDPNPARVGGDSSPRVTKAKYDSVAKGMSYREVRDVIGFAGEEMSRSTVGGIETVMYSWANPDGSNMNATFQDDRMEMKAQFGLK
jgi:hypothetical protein